jgi:hypothetical protein
MMNEPGETVVNSDRRTDFSAMEERLWSALHEAQEALSASRENEARLQSLVDQARACCLTRNARSPPPTHRAARRRSCSCGLEPCVAQYLAPATVIGSNSRRPAAALATRPSGPK